MWWDIFIGFSKLWLTHTPNPPSQQPSSLSQKWICFLQSSIFSLSRQLITFHGRSLLFQFTEQTCSKYSVAFQKISKPRGKFCEEWQILSILLIGFEHSRDVLQDVTQIKILIIRLSAYFFYLPLYCSAPPSFPISWFFFLLRQITLNITTMEGRFLLANKHEWIKAHFFFFCCFSELWPFCHFP